MRRHFRRFLTVETEAGEALSFRFYDPRVLRPFLASATEDEGAGVAPKTLAWRIRTAAAVAGPGKLVKAQAASMEMESRRWGVT